MFLVVCFCFGFLVNHLLLLWWFCLNYSSRCSDTQSHIVLYKMWQYHNLYWFHLWSVWGATSCFCIIIKDLIMLFEVYTVSWFSLFYHMVHRWLLIHLNWWKSTCVPWGNKGSDVKHKTVRAGLIQNPKLCLPLCFTDLYIWTFEF